MIVFIHGLGCDPSSLKSMATFLTSNDDKWIVELPKNANPQMLSDSILLESAIADISSGLEAEGEIHIIAHSLGAALAIPVATIVGSRLKSLIIFEGNLAREDCGLLSNELSKLKTKDEVDRFIASFSSSSDSALKAWATMASQYDATTLIGYAKELVATSENGQLLKTFLNLRCEKKYVYGDDYLHHPTTEKISESDLWYLEGTGHFAVLEQPELCAQIIDRAMSTGRLRKTDPVIDESMLKFESIELLAAAFATISVIALKALSLWVGKNRNRSIKFVAGNVEMEIIGHFRKDEVFLELETFIKAVRIIRESDVEVEVRNGKGGRRRFGIVDPDIVSSALADIDAEKDSD